MAEGFANIYGKKIVQPFSCGSRPSGVVSSKAITSMAEIGYDLSTHHCKRLDEIPQSGYTFIITMGCGDACPHIETEKREDWDLPDPENMPPKEFNRLRDTIAAEVKELIDRLPD